MAQRTSEASWGLEAGGELPERSTPGPGMIAPAALREQVRDGFQTVTSQSYHPLEMPDGKCPLPSSLYQTSSGYSREKASTAPTSKEVSGGPGPGRALSWGGRGAGPERVGFLQLAGLPC